MKNGKSKTKTSKNKSHTKKVKKKLKRRHSSETEETSTKDKKRYKSSIAVLSDGEPDGMVNGLSTKRGSFGNSSIVASKGLARAYTGDLGTKGIKAKATNGMNVPNTPNTFNVPLTNDEERRRKERQARFSNTSDAESSSTANAVNSALSSRRTFGSSIGSKTKKRKNKSVANSDTKNGQHCFVGTCQNLEKPYLRLTTFPKPQDVRPLSVLQRSIVHIKKRYTETEDFEWANEQLKSLRQDLTVQGLRNDFVLEAYETHARILLEHGDLNEFNQCQTMIKSLTMGLSSSVLGKDTEDEDSEMECFHPNRGERNNKKEEENILLKQSKDSADEFGAYRLLYALVQKDWGEMTKELLNANALMDGQSNKTVEDDKRSQRMSSCEHAVLVAKSVIHNDYHTFFRLYESALNLSAFLMDFLVQRVRKGAYERIVASYRPTISVEFFREALFFHDLEETRTFLKQSGAVFVKEGSGGGPPFWIDCKASR